MSTYGQSHSLTMRLERHRDVNCLCCFCCAVVAKDLLASLSIVPVSGG